MQPSFDFGHLDTSRDPPEVYGAALDLLCEFWARLRTFRSSCHEEEFLIQLTSGVENQVIAAALLLVIKVELLSDR